MIPFAGSDLLHMERIYCDPGGVPVLMLHGAIGNARVFYSEKGRGLGPYLARHGYDVYAADLRGRGGSVPHLDRSSGYGQTESITQEITAFTNAISDMRPDQRQHWIAHSWGGVLMTSHLARFPGTAGRVRSLVYFGSKRRVDAVNLTRILQIDLYWGMVARLITSVRGYLPGRIGVFGLGSDDETRKSHLHCALWARGMDWVDPDDGFDYGSAVMRVSLPPALYFAAAKDRCLGHPEDVLRFMKESGQGDAPFVLLGKDHGNLHDYRHVSMITHPDAVDDHFPSVLRWLNDH